MAFIETNTNVKAYLDVIAASEGTSSSSITKLDGYDVLVTGINGPATFDDFLAHPFENGRQSIVVRVGPPQLRSTASGRYQIILSTYKRLAAESGCTRFAPINQDALAIQLLKDCRAMQHLLDGEIAAATAAAAIVWASLPGAPYGQPEHDMTWVLNEFAAAIGRYAIS